MTTKPAYDSEFQHRAPGVDRGVDPVRTGFEAMLSKARREGVARQENLPFLLEPSSPAKAAVVLVHGFTASPWEMRKFGEALAKAGYLAVGVRLPGHGTTARDLSERRYEEWLEEVDATCRLLQGQGLMVFGAGMSTGSLLLLACAERQFVDGLVLMSPFLKLRHRLAPAVGILRFVMRYQRRTLPADQAHFYYAQRPLNGVYQLYRLIRHVRSHLSQVTTPSLILSASGDQTIHAASAKDLFQQLGSFRKEYHLFGPEVPHVLTTDENPRWQEAFDLTLGFFRDLEGETDRPEAG